MIYVKSIAPVFSLLLSIIETHAETVLRIIVHLFTRTTVSGGVLISFTISN
jgi:hypothetical protein